MSELKGIWIDPETGYKYWWEKKAAKHKVDICLGTTDPEKYCNGVFLYSSKDPGTGIEFVVVNTDDPETFINLIGNQIDPQEIWDAKEPRKYDKP